MTDARGHLHDALGRFARTGAVRVERTEPRTRKVKRAVPAGAARSKWDRVRDRADAVSEVQARHISGERVTDRESMNLLYHWGAAAHRRGDETVMDRRTALQRATGPLRGVKGAGFRYSTKRTSTGKATAQRGHKGRELPDGTIRGFGLRTRVLNGAGKKRGATTRSARSVFSATTYRPRHVAD